MGTVHSLRYDKCELLVSNENLVEFHKTLKDLFKTEFSNDLLRNYDSFWLFREILGYSPMFDLHFKRDAGGLLLDEIESQQKTGFDNLVEKLKSLFIKFQGTLWAWQYDDSSGEFHNFFKIQDGKEMKFDFKNRPYNWFNETLPTTIIPKDNVTFFDTIELKRRIIEGQISFSTDKCNIMTSSEDIIFNLQKEFNTYFKNNEVKLTVERLKDRKTGYINYEMEHYPEYNEVIHWIGPICATFCLDRISSEKVKIIDVNIYQSLRKTENDINFILSLSQLVVKNALANNGELWGYYESGDQKILFFKIQNKRYYEFLFSGRPDNW